MKNSILIAAFIPIFFALTACAPDTFTLYENTDNALFGKKLTSIDSVETERGETVTIFSGGKAAIRYFEQTNFEMEFYATLKEGSGMTFTVRSVAIEFDVTPGVSLTYGTHGWRVEEAGRILAVNDSARALLNRAERILLRSDGERLQVIAGCTEIFNGKVQSPGTEWLIAEAHSGSRIELARFNRFATVPEHKVSVSSGKAK